MTKLVDIQNWSDYILDERKNTKTAMLKKSSHILIITVLALNLTGAMAFSFTTDCGMQCCVSAEWAGTGNPSLEAPSCCDMDGVTCGFEGSQYQELFDDAICCFNKVGSAQDVSDDLLNATGIHPPVHSSTHALTLHSTGPPKAVPLYLSNATLLC